MLRLLPARVSMSSVSQLAQQYHVRAAPECVCVCCVGNGRHMTTGATPAVNTAVGADMGAPLPHAQLKPAAPRRGAGRQQAAVYLQ